MDIAEKDTGCIAFNTLGFFKNKLNKLSISNYFKECDGIYIKKEYYEQCQNNRSLKEIAEYFILDKCEKYGHNYIPVYSKWLDSIRDNIKNIFEIGIGSIENGQMIQMLKYNYKTGNSLRAWKEYCKNANVYGIDIFKEGLFEEPRIKTYVCDQSNPEQLNKLMDKLNVTMDLILDDGSHVIEHQVISFIALEKYLSIDGIYIIEDIWNKNFEIWKQLSCFSVDYQKYIKEKYDVFYYDQSSLRSNTSDCICIFKKKVHKLEQIQNNIKLKINELGNQSNKIQIKMLCNWTNSEQLCKEWSNMCTDPANFSWTSNSNSNINSKQLQLTWTNKREEIDYYVIINSPPQNEYYDPSRTIVFQMEPWVNNLNNNWGVKTWGQWAEPDPTKFLAVRGRKTHTHNNAFWQLELTLNDLTNVLPVKELIKSTTISSICSSKYFDEGHIARIDLLKFLENKGDIKIDIYNSDNNHNFKNYRGPLTPYIDKSKGLIPYKYYFMIENNYEPDFITEKIWEPILCETLCFYFGCPNVHEYIDPQVYVLLPIHDFEKCYQIMKQAIEEDWFSQRIDIIKREKQKILNELAFFPVIDKIIQQNKQTDLEVYNTYFEEFNNKNYNKLLSFLQNYNASAWLGHLKFAMWLVNKYKPKVTLELGVDYGHSAFAFASEGIGKVYGLDCFEGDIHAGHRDTLKQLIDTKQYLLDNNMLVTDNFYPIKGYFNEIHKTFNEEIDILHIDGLHTYEAVSEDFNTWITKTNDNSIILMHDVISFKDTVGKFFNEIPYPKTYFSHSAGLGVVSKNQSIIDDINTKWLTNNNPLKYCFIHSCNLKNIGINILTEIVEQLIDSNLIQQLEKIFIINIGIPIDENIYKNDKIKIINYSDNIYLYEISTINLIHTFCKYNQNCEILYLHTKGITCSTSELIIDWKNMMTHFLINKHTECFSLLKKYDAIGSNYSNLPHKHFSGNFWWATSNYINTLNKISIPFVRHDAEWWILSRQNVNYFELHNSGINHYQQNYPKEKYIMHF